MFRMQSFLALACALLIAGCATPSANLIRPSEGGPNAGEAIVVTRISGMGPGLMGIGTVDRSLSLAAREEGSQRHFYIYAPKEKPQAFHIPAGTYSFLHFSFGDFIIVQEPLLDLPYSAEGSIPVRPFTVRPGEVVYLGDLTVHGIRHEVPVLGPSPQISYSVASDEAAARAAVEADYPGRSGTMVTRLFEIEPAAVHSGAN